MRTFGIIITIVGAVLGLITNLVADDSRLQMGTSLIAIVRPQSRIVFAADSRRAFIPLDGTELKTSEICKINRLSDSIFFAPTGFLARQSFRVTDIVRQAYKETNNIAKTIELVETRLQDALRKTHLEIRKKSPEFYQKEFTRLEKVGLFIFGAQFGTLFIYDREFIVRRLSSNISVDLKRRTICPGNWCQAVDARIFVVSAGKNKAISEYQKRTPIPSTVTEEVNWINNAMNAQISATPLDVGAPIDIVSITPSGEMQWIQAKNECKM